jgi:hypothetical protein
MASKIYVNPETSITWTDSVTGGDEDLDLGDGALGLADAVGCGSYHDWGTAPRAFGYYVTLKIDGFATAPVVGETVDLYMAESEDATIWTGPESPSDTADSAGATVRLPNLKFLGSAVVTTVTAADDVVASFEWYSTARYTAPVVHNNTADALLTTSDAHKVIMTPIPYEGQ